MSKTETTFKKEALKRISIARGHLEKVGKMLEEEAYCPDIIHQSRAIQAALKKVDEIILHGHLHSCVLKDIHSTGGKNERLVEEIVELFRKEE
jgi:DNA-binding FrmR family transcriptional regulator